MSGPGAIRLFEAIVQANHRGALEGKAPGNLRPDEFADSLPVVLLTCIDPRLNPLIPEVLGIRDDQFIWLRNAGNVISAPFSSTLRSLALACAIKGGREIAVVGHTDCAVRKTSVTDLVDRFKAMGIERQQLPDDLHAFFGLFASEGQNVMRGVEWVRSSPLIGQRIPVHGLILDLKTGKLDWVVNGYQALSGAPAPQEKEVAWRPLADFTLAEMKFPEFTPIAGSPSAPAENPEARSFSDDAAASQNTPAAAAGPTPPPLPPVIRLRQPWKRGR